MKRPSLWFIVPCFRRFDRTAIALGHLASVCDELRERGVEADACVIADDANLAVAEAHGFALIEQGNASLGVKLNDGYLYAAEQGVDYVVPFNSGALVTADLIVRSLPDGDVISAFHRSSIVSEDGVKLAKLFITYAGGDGIKVWPLRFFEKCGFRPANEVRRSGMDGSTRDSVKRALRLGKGEELPFVYRESDALEIAEFKSPNTGGQRVQINS